jgi:hypothetical protein
MPPANEQKHACILTAAIDSPLTEGAALETVNDTNERYQIYYLALGARRKEIENLLDWQRKSPLWDRQWICGLDEVDSIKILALWGLRSALDNTLLAYAQYGIPAIEVPDHVLPMLIRDVDEIIDGYENRERLMPLDVRLSHITFLIKESRLEETMRLLKDPPSAKLACWLINFRDELYGRHVTIPIEELPWSVRVDDWDTLACKAIHRDGHAIVFDGLSWKPMPLREFWLHHCGHLKLHEHDGIPINWRRELYRANRPPLPIK